MSNGGRVLTPRALVQMRMVRHLAFLAIVLLVHIMMGVQGCETAAGAYCSWDECCANLYCDEDGVDEWCAINASGSCVSSLT
jgi:hypothetical protein